MAELKVRQLDDRVAAAGREGAGLVTADRRLEELARHRGIATVLVPSA